MKKLLLLLAVAICLKATSQTIDTVYNADNTSYYFLHHYNTAPVSINIPPLVNANTIVMRKAQTFVQSFNQKAKTVAVSVTIMRYSFNGSNFNDTSYVDESNYGPLLEDGISKSIEIIATNATLVNVITGEIIKTPAIGQNVIGQYDFFFMLADNEPIVLNELIKKYLRDNKDWN